MVYIHVKKIGDVNYYTLRISVRKGKKVITKDLENLGSDISKISISNLEKRYKEEIRKSYNSIKKFLDSNIYLEKAKKKKLKKNIFFEKEQLESIEAIRTHFNTKFKKIDKLGQQEVFENFIIKFAVNSTSLEGNTITLKEADKLLRENILPKNKTLREVFDLRNTKKVFNELISKRPLISLFMIEKIHDSLMENIDQRKGYRTDDINIFGQPFKPTPGRYVKDDMKLLLDWYSNNKDLHPLVLAILFHHKFENIHPFSDGNGRTGRMLMNHILLRCGYPLLVISRRERKKYLESMSEADKSIKKDLRSTNIKYYKKLIGFVYSQLEESYWDTFLV